MYAWLRPPAPTQRPLNATPPLHPPLLLQFVPAAPLSIPSAKYTTQLAEVFALGRSTSAQRTAQQTDTAHFWADGNSERRRALPAANATAMCIHC
jgi:hypothetical protein